VTKSLLRVEHEIGINQALQRGQQARDVGDGIFRLPAVVEEI